MLEGSGIRLKMDSQPEAYDFTLAGYPYRDKISGIPETTLFFNIA